MLSPKISGEFKNSGISTPSIDTFRSSRDPKSMSETSLRVIELSSLVFPYFELDIRQDQTRKAFFGKKLN